MDTLGGIHQDDENIDDGYAHGEDNNNHEG
jgi:hypothetical protein